VGLIGRIHFGEVGGVGMPCGSKRRGCVIAAWTSTLLHPLLRVSVNSSVICVLPTELTEVISPAGNRRELIFERRGDGGRHRLGTCSRKLSSDDSVGNPRSEGANRKVLISNDAEERDGRHQEAGRDRTPDMSLRIHA